MPHKNRSKRAADTELASIHGKRRVTRSVAKKLVTLGKKLFVQDKFLSIPSSVFAEHVSSFLDKDAVRTTMEVGPLARSFELGKYCCKKHGTKFDVASITTVNMELMRECRLCRTEEKDAEMKEFGMFRCFDCDDYDEDVLVCNACQVSSSCADCDFGCGPYLFECAECNTVLCDNHGIQFCDFCDFPYCGPCAEDRMMECKICNKVLGSP